MPVKKLRQNPVCPGKQSLFVPYSTCCEVTENEAEHTAARVSEVKSENPGAKNGIYEAEKWSIFSNRCRLKG
jgi:hypothetical protein